MMSAGHLFVNGCQVKCYNLIHVADFYLGTIRGFPVSGYVVQTYSNSNPQLNSVLALLTQVSGVCFPPTVHTLGQRFSTGAP